MPRVSPIQESFAAGEISENVRGRVSSDVYKTGLKFCENWVPQVQGSIRMRDGSQYTGDMDPRNSAAVLFTFSVSLDQDFIVEVGDAFIIVRDGNTGLQITGGDSGNLVIDPTFQSELTFWSFDNNQYTIGASISNSQITWQPVEGAFTETLSMNNDPGFPEPEPDGAKGGELTQTIQVPTGADAIAHTIEIDFNALISTGDITRLGGAPLSDMEVVIRTGATEEIIPITDAGFNMVSFTYTPNAPSFTLGLGVRYTALPIPPDQVSPLRSYEIPFQFFEASVVVALPGGSGTPVEFASPYSIPDLMCMHSAMDPAEAELWITSASNNVEPRQITFDGIDWVMTALSAVVGFMAPTPNVWAAGNYPSAVTIRDGRLWLGNVPTDRATMWGSRSGVYVDFDNAGAVNPNDPVLFPLAAAGKITALSNKKQLIINTDVSEIVGVSSIPGNVIAFNDFGFPPQTDWGASCVQPVGVGRQLIYASPSDRKLRTFADEGGTNFGWDGVELNLLAQDLFGTKIIDMDWSDEPSYQYLCVLGNGTLAVATYYYPEKVIGFYRMTTDGLVKSISITNTSSGAVVWMLIDREGTWRLEKMPFNSGNRHAMDSWVLNDIDLAGVIIGLDHLEGKTVKVVVRDVDPTSGNDFWAVYPDEVVVAGSITLTNASTFGLRAFVGLEYNNSFQLLSLEGVSNRGTSQTSKRRWNKVFLRLVDSAIPLVEGQYPQDRSPATPMNLGEPFKSGDFEIVDLGSGEGDIVISQDRPLISEVSAIFGKVQSSEI